MNAGRTMLAAVVLGWGLSFGAGGVAAATDAGAAAIDVRGVTRCPTAAAVSAALVGLITAANAAPAPDVVDLTDAGTSVDVKLTTSAGALIAQKRLPPSLSCDQRARTVAVLVAAWEVRLRAGAPPPLPVAATSPPPQRTTVGEAVPSSRSTAAASGVVPPPTPAIEPAPRTPPAPATASAPPPPAPPPAPPVVTTGTPMSPARSDVARATATATSPPLGLLETETGAALFASVASGTVAPAALVEAIFRPHGSRFGLAAGAIAVGTHTVSLGDGQGTWRRFGGLVGLHSNARWRVVEVELQGSIAMTALAVTGRSFPLTSSATLFDPGVLAGLRLRLRPGRLSPWIEAAGAFWPRTHTLYVTGTTESSDLPPFQAFFGLGLSLGPDL